jgi:F-type H+-transporting ATPase subunit epsilon
MATISFDLVSPESLIFNDDVGTIIVPGKDGDLGVLPGHTQVMSSLRPGRVMIYSEDKNLVKSFFVSGGFAEINPEKCIVLAESAVELNSLDKFSIEKEIEELGIKEDKESVEQLSIAKAKLEAVTVSFYDKI